MPWQAIWRQCLVVMGCLALIAVAGCANGRAGPDNYSADEAGAVETGNAYLDTLRYEVLLTDEKRLKGVSYRLLRTALPLCVDRKSLFFGIVAARLSDVAAKNRAAARALLGLDQRLRVLYIVPGSPADRSGIRSGDIVREVNGSAAGTGASVSAETLLERPLTGPDPVGGQMHLVIERRARTMNVNVDGEPVCTTATRIDDRVEVNAWSSEDGVSVSRGMLDFARTEPELAMVVAHEISHILLNHTDGFLGYLAPQRQLEEEADYAAVYLMARAGYEPADGLGLLRRMVARFDQINDTATHPPTRKRFRLLEATIREVHGKRAAGTPLLPKL